jgi:hypothetical protein
MLSDKASRFDEPAHLARYGEPQLSRLHELVFDLTVVLARVATEVTPGDTRPILASIHELDDWFARVRNTVTDQADVLAVETAVDQLGEVLARVREAAVRVGADQAHHVMVAEGAARLREYVRMCADTSAMLPLTEVRP